MPPWRSIFSWDKSDEALLPSSLALLDLTRYRCQGCANMVSHMSGFPFSWNWATVIWEYAGSIISLLTRVGVHAGCLYQSAVISTHQETGILWWYLSYFVTPWPCSSHESFEPSHISCSSHILQPWSTAGPKLKAVTPNLSSFPHEISVHEVVLSTN